MAFIVFAVALLSSVISQDQDLELECAFSVDWIGDYTCILQNIEVLDPEQNVIIVGEHVEGRTNDDVTIVDVLNSNTPFMIPQIFTTFPSITHLEISNSNLESINIPDSVRLRMLVVDRNNISRIENGTFANQDELWYLNARDSNIQEIDEDGFVGLGAIVSLVLIGNQIESIAPRTFHPLVNVSYLDLEVNRLTSIGDGVFSQNTRLSSLYLGFNQIEKISPTFSAGFGDNLGFIDLEQNECVSRRFEIDSDDDFTRIILHNSLRTCFNNFQGTPSNLRRVVLEFQGPLRLYDEFNNLIASL